jgi:hypothetical protein
MDSNKKTARLAGLLYVLSSLTAPFALIYVPNKLMVRGDAAATADRIRASETMLRWGIAAELLGTVVFIFVALVLYRLFKPVSEKHALAMMVLFLLSVPISFLNVLNEIAALNFAQGGTNFLSVLDAPQRDAMAYLFMRLHGRGFVLAQVFWGLWLFPFGACVIRSGFIPRFLGVLLMVAGVGYLADSFAELVLPQYTGAVGRVTAIMNFGELPIIFWLLIWGAKPQRGSTPGG